MAQYNRKDHYYQKAKSEGARSRAFYKLEELQRKYKIIKPGYRVVDLGAWPGGWLQQTAKMVGPKGLAVGIDLVEIEDFGSENIKTIQGDARDDEVIQQAITLCGGKCNVLLSDMAPKLTGIREVDHAATSGLTELVFELCGDLLRPGGTLVMKVFKCNDTEVAVREARSSFEKLTREELKSTRKGSSEYYLIGTGYK